VNAIVMPPGYASGFHYHDEQDELYFVHQGARRGSHASQAAQRRPRRRDLPMRRWQGRLRRARRQTARGRAARQRAASLKGITKRANCTFANPRGAPRREELVNRSVRGSRVDVAGPRACVLGAGRSPV
jgi:hypothetical protein